MIMIKVALLELYCLVFQSNHHHHHHHHYQPVGAPLPGLPNILARAISRTFFQNSTSTSLTQIITNTDKIANCQCYNILFSHHLFHFSLEQLGLLNLLLLPHALTWHVLKISTICQIARLPDCQIARLPDCQIVSGTILPSANNEHYQPPYLHTHQALSRTVQT